MNTVVSDVLARQKSESLIKKHTPLVTKIAYYLVSRMPATVHVEDLIQSGMIGLLEAARNYDDSKGASFETFATIRIRGAMLDEVRRADWTPRSVYRNTRLIKQAIQSIENRAGREARDYEVAAELEISLAEYRQLLMTVRGSVIVSYEDVAVPDDDSSTGLTSHLDKPHDEMENSQLKSSLARAISKLPEREALVMSLYYDEELNLKEIGEILGVSESRVCQIHHQAMLRLQSRMQDWQ